MAFLSYKNAFDMEKATTAIAGFPTLEEAVDYLKGMGHQTTVDALKAFERWAPERIQKRREELAPDREKRLLTELLTTAEITTRVTNLAIEKTEEQIAAGKCADPAKAARDISQVKTQTLDKYLTLSGRPTKIVQTGSYEDIIRQLVAMKVATVDEPAELLPADD